MTDIQTYVTLEETREEHYPIKEMNINALCETIMEKAKANFKPEVGAVGNVPRVNIKTNAEALERILLYLLGNAALHTDNGKITLEFKKRSAHTGQFIITDTGTGIPAELTQAIGWAYRPAASSPINLTAPCIWITNTRREPDLYWNYMINKIPAYFERANISVPVGL